MKIKPDKASISHFRTIVECKEKGKPTMQITLHGVYSEKTVREKYKLTLLVGVDDSKIELTIKEWICPCGEIMVDYDYYLQCYNADCSRKILGGVDYE